MRIVIAGLIALGVAMPSFASDRAAKIKTLMEAQGLSQMFEEQRTRTRERCKEQSQQMLDQVFTLINTTPEVTAQLRSASTEFMESVQAPWSAQDVVDAWAAAYAPQFSDDELDQLVAFYTSPLGQKDAIASRAAMPQVSQHFADLSKPIVEKSTKAYVERIQAIIRDCKCKKG